MSADFPSHFSRRHMCASRPDPCFGESTRPQYTLKRCQRTFFFFFSGLGDHASDPKAADAEAFPGTVRLDSADFCGAGGLVLLHGAPDEPVVPNLWCQGHSRQQT